MVAMGFSLIAICQSPIYMNNFEEGLGTTKVVGGGKIEKSTSTLFGSVFHNAASGQAIRTNYLLLPEDIFANVQASGKKELTIAFWVNVGTAKDYFWTPIFTAYGAAPAAGKNTWPMMAFQSRLWAQVNCAGWNDFVNADNTAGKNLESTAWIEDGKWHYYSVTITTSSVKIYIDGTILNSWNVPGTDGHTVNGIFSNGSELKYICLGGNQAWDWADPDPAFLFDDVAIYTSALSIDQIKANIAAKTTTSTKPLIQESNGELLSTEYFSISGSKVGKEYNSLNPGVYIKQSIYENGAIKCEKIAKTSNR